MNGPREPAADAPGRLPIDGATRGTTWVALATSGGTLVCCAWPALLGSIVAGAALAGLVSACPQGVWLSEHKGPVFGAAFVALAVSGAMQWRARRAPCPADPGLADACRRARRASRRVYVVSVVLTVIGVWFAFIAPALD